MNGIAKKPKETQIKDFDQLNFTQKCVNVINLELGNISEYDDRFGLFFDNPGKTLTLSELRTEKSFAEITDLAAQSYLGKNIAVAWSGGIDSSLIVAALYKHNIDFKVTVMHERCLAENPDMYAWVLANCNTISLDEDTHFLNLYDHVTNGVEIISGDPADLLYPGIRYNLMPGITHRNNLYDKDARGYGDNIDLFNQNYPDEYFYNNIKERLAAVCSEHGSYLTLPENFSEDVVSFVMDRLAKNNIDFKHYYQLKWLTKFTLRYASHQQRVATIIKNRFAYYGREYVDVVQHDFFDTIEYQSWALTNLDRIFDTQSITAKTQKMDAKEYIVSVTQLPSQLNLIKIPSL
jgi:hypothetical protein